MIRFSARFLAGLCLAALGGCSAKDEVPPAVVVGASVDAGASAAAPKPAGRLDEPRGSVTLVHGGASRVVSAAADLFPTDAVETGEDGAALLRLADGRVIELGPTGRFELGEDGQGLVLTVARGLVITRVAPPPPTDAGAQLTVTLSISTPFGLTRVGSSEVKIDVEETRASVEVKVGEIELVSRSGEVKKVSSGQPLVLGAPRELPTITLNLVIASGRVEVKRKNAKGFTAVNPKKLPGLADGDTVRVVDGRAVLAPEGSATRLIATRGTELSVEKVQRGEGVEASAFELKKGELQVQAPAGQKTGLQVGNGVTLQSDGSAQYAVRRTGSGVEVQSQIGAVHIAWAGHDDVTLPSGGLAVLAGAAPRLVEASRELLQLPTHNGLKVFHSGLSRASLTWDETEGVKAWRVAVSSDPNFATTILEGVVSAPFLNVPVPARGPLYWRVYQGEEEKFRGNASFAPEASSSDLSRAKNVVPDGPDTTTIYFQDKPPTVTFTWKKDDEAARYAVKVYRDQELGKAVAERTTAESQVSLPESTLGEGKYLWSVTALAANGSELKGGRLNKLQMVYDNAVPGLVIRAPHDGEQVKWPARVVGIAPVGARVYVNGRALPLDDKARFDAEVAPLAGGRLVFRLVNGGAEVFTVRTVRR